MNRKVRSMNVKVTVKCSVYTEWIGFNSAIDIPTQNGMRILSSGKVLRPRRIGTNYNDSLKLSVFSITRLVLLSFKPFCKFLYKMAISKSLLYEYVDYYASLYESFRKFYCQRIFSSYLNFFTINLSLNHESRTCIVIMDCCWVVLLLM